jgi:hypothetical protein
MSCQPDSHRAPPRSTTSTGQVLINDVNQGSGRGDLRYRIPLSILSSPVPADCGYLDPACSTYFVLYNKWGAGAGTTYASDGGFEEWKVKIYPTLRINKVAVGGDATFGYTVAGPTPSTPSITTSGGSGTTGTFIVDPGTYQINETTVPAGWSCVQQERRSADCLHAGKQHRD